MAVLKFLVVDDRNDKRNDGSIHRILTLQDQSRPALTHTLAYEPKAEEDLKKLPDAGKAVDVEIELAVRAIKWNNFQLCQEVSLGTIVQVIGAGANGASKAVGK